MDSLGMVFWGDGSVRSLGGRWVSRCSSFYTQQMDQAIYPTYEICSK